MSTFNEQDHPRHNDGRFAGKPQQSAGIGLDATPNTGGYQQDELLAHSEAHVQAATELRYADARYRASVFAQRLSDEFGIDELPVKYDTEELWIDYIPDAEESGQSDWDLENSVFKTMEECGIGFKTMSDLIGSGTYTFGQEDRDRLSERRAELERRLNAFSVKDQMITAATRDSLNSGWPVPEWPSDMGSATRSMEADDDGEMEYLVTADLPDGEQLTIAVSLPDSPAESVFVYSSDGDMVDADNFAKQSPSHRQAILHATAWARRTKYRHQEMLGHMTQDPDLKKALYD